MNGVGSRIPHEIMGIKYTNIERNLMEKLSDGEPYTVDELKMHDPLAEDIAMQVHIHNIRKKIVLSHYRIHAGNENRRMVYRLVKILV